MQASSIRALALPRRFFISGIRGKAARVCRRASVGWTCFFVHIKYVLLWDLINMDPSGIERLAGARSGMVIGDERLMTSCPIGCGNRFADTGMVLLEGNLLRCLSCGQLVSQIGELAYRASMMEFDSTTGTLPNASSQNRHDERVGRMLRRIQQLMNVAPGESIRLLDIGCSTGALLMSARREGFEVEGIEPATRAAQAAQATGLKVFAGTLHEASLPPSSFHAATLIEVIEHLVAPGDLLREAWRILKPGGVLLVGTGNAASWTVGFMGGSWEYFQVNRHGGHISFFTPYSLGLLAARCGFRIERLETRHVRFVESYQAAPVVYRSLKVLGELLNAPARLLNRGHDMLAFLRKV